MPPECRPKDRITKVKLNRSAMLTIELRANMQRAMGQRSYMICTLARLNWKNSMRAGAKPCAVAWSGNMYDELLVW